MDEIRLPEEVRQPAVNNRSQQSAGCSRLKLAQTPPYPLSGHVARLQQSIGTRIRKRQN
jgi:hypothetical protein